MDYEKAYKEAQERARTGKPMNEVFPELKESEDERIRKELIGYLTHRAEVTAFVDETKDCERWVAYLEKQKEQKSAEKQDYSGLTELERAIHRGFLCAGVENVPIEIIKETAQECRLVQMKSAEWSEEDKAILLSIKCVIDSVWHNFDYDCSKEELKEMWDWLDTLWQRVEYPQSKQEWNEEDKLIIQNIVLWLDGQYISETARIQCLEWLNKHRRDFLIQPHWKPSAEQMEALDEYIWAKEPNKDKAKYVISLYRDLKKL